jgi:hypothetical protein
MADKLFLILAHLDAHFAVARSVPTTLRNAMSVSSLGAHPPQALALIFGLRRGADPRARQRQDRAMFLAVQISRERKFYQFNSTMFRPRSAYHDRVCATYMPVGLMQCSVASTNGLSW